MPQRPRHPRPNSRTRKDHGPDLPVWGSGRNAIAAWRDGVVVPLIPAILGLFPLISGHFETSSRNGRPLVLDGGPARALGLAAIALGACIHIYNFWGTHPTLARWGQPALLTGFAVFLTMLGYIAYATLF